MLKHILPIIPDHKSYIEPFCGGAAVFFAKPIARLNVLNDRMELLVNMYRQAKLFPDEFLRLVNSMPYAKSEYERTKQITQDAPDKHEPIVRAVAFWYQCASSFLKKPGHGYARDTAGDRPEYNIYKISKSELSDKLAMLDNVQIEEDDAVSCIKRYDRETAFFYCDPPYVNTECGAYNGYTETDYRRLLETLSGIRGKFLLSCFDTELLNNFVSDFGWHKAEINSNSSAKNGNNGTGGRKIELLIRNYQTPNETVNTLPWWQD